VLPPRRDVSNGAIIGMSQNYVGSNNINVLLPNGQFGSRLNGNDSASERYIYTCLNPITRRIFNEADDAILNYLDDDGRLLSPSIISP
jgi:DNA topoisomerase-2